MPDNVTKCRAKTANDISCRNKRKDGSLYCQIHRSQPEVVPPYIDRCSMLLVQKSDKVASYCSFLGNGGSCNLWHEVKREGEIFDTEKPHDCDAFLWSRLLQIHHRRLENAKLSTIACGRLTEHQITYDLGPGYDWKDAVVQARAIEHEKYLYFNVGECWDRHSQPSPLVRWLCHFDDIREFAGTGQHGTMRLVMNSGESIEFVPFLDKKNQVRDSQNFQDLVDRWNRGK